MPIEVQDVVYHNQTLEDDTDMSEVHVKAQQDGVAEIVLEMKLSKMYSKRLKICKQLKKGTNWNTLAYNFDVGSRLESIKSHSFALPNCNNTLRVCVCLTLKCIKFHKCIKLSSYVEKSTIYV